jgi:matrixin
MAAGDSHFPRSKWIAGLLACALIGGGALASSASAYRLGERDWPAVGTITYYATPGSAWSVNRAMYAFNRARIGVRFRRVGLPRDAQIRIEHFREVGSARIRSRVCSSGLAGAAIPGDSNTNRFAGARVYLPRWCTAKVKVLIAAHEVGHVLGLRHELRRCALMNPTLWLRRGVPYTSRCRTPASWRHPLRRDDVAGLRRMFALSRSSRSRSSRLRSAQPRFLCWAGGH